MNMNKQSDSQTIRTVVKGIRANYLQLGYGCIEQYG